MNCTVFLRNDQLIHKLDGIAISHVLSQQVLARMEYNHLGRRHTLTAN